MAGKPVVQDASAAATLAVGPTNPFIALTHRDFRPILGGRQVATSGSQKRPGATVDQAYCSHNRTIEPGLIGASRTMQLRAPNALRGRAIVAKHIFVPSGPQLGQREAGVVASIFGVRLSIALLGSAIRRYWYAV